MGLKAICRYLLHFLIYLFSVLDVPICEDGQHLSNSLLSRQDLAESLAYREISDV